MMKRRMIAAILSIFIILTGVLPAQAAIPQTDTASLQKAFDEAQAAVDEAQDAYDEGMAGFFRWQIDQGLYPESAAAALSILEDSGNPSEAGQAGDASAFDNVLPMEALLTQCNALRADEGYGSTLRVTNVMMAKAEISANHSVVTLSASIPFYNESALTWGAVNPIESWRNPGNNDAKEARSTILRSSWQVVGMARSRMESPSCESLLLGSSYDTDLPGNESDTLDALSVNDYFDLLRTYLDTIGLDEKKDALRNAEMLLSARTEADAFFANAAPDGLPPIIVSRPTLLSQEMPFVDVPADAYYHSAALWAYNIAITKGTDATHFSPTDVCSRAQIVTFLWRLNGAPKASGKCPFTDIRPSDYYYDAVIWAYSNHITVGITDTTFGPELQCTRAQIVTFLARNAGVGSADTTIVSKFRDVADNAYYASPVSWAITRHVTNGTGLNTFSPDNPCTRAEAVTFLYRSQNPDKEVYNTDDKIHYINFNEWGTDCMLLESNGKCMMVDAANPDSFVGGQQAVLDDTGNINAVLRYLPQIGVTHLDYLVLTHNHSDHIGGVKWLCEAGYIDKNTTVYYRANLATDEEETLPHWENLRYLQIALDSLEESGAKIVSLYDENITQLDFSVGDFHVEFRNLDEDHDGYVDFYTDDENRNSIVLKVTKGSISTLLGGDLTCDIEQKLVDNGIGHINVMKAHHHGSRTSNSYELISAIRPEAIVLTRDLYSGEAPYAYIRSQNIPIYAMGTNTRAAIVETVFDSYYTIAGAPTYSRTLPDGYYYWLWKYSAHTVCLENGELLRNATRVDPDYDEYEYYFNADGIA